jgi:hypothetical protein
MSTGRDLCVHLSLREGWRRSADFARWDLQMGDADTAVQEDLVGEVTGGQKSPDDQCGRECSFSYLPRCERQDVAAARSPGSG